MAAYPSYIVQPHAPLAPQAIAALRQTPGVWVNPYKGWIKTPIDAGFIIGTMLNSWGVPWSAKPEGETWRFEGGPAALAECERIRQQIFASAEVDPVVRAKLYPFQIDGAITNILHTNGFLHFPCGSGKTFTSWLWAQHVPGTVLYFVRPSARIQIANAIREISGNTVDPLVLLGVSDQPGYSAAQARIVSLRKKARDTEAVVLKDIAKERKTLDREMAKAIATISTARVGSEKRRDAMAMRDALLAPGPLTALSPEVLAERTLTARKALLDEADQLEVSLQGRKQETPKDYVARMATLNKRAVIIAGHNQLETNHAALAALHAVSVIFDEIHQLKSNNRYAYRPKDNPEEGKARYDAIPRDNQAYGAEQVSRSALRRLGVTATALEDRVRDLYAQWDLIIPGVWGRGAVSFRYRHCGAVDHGYGLDDTGATNLEELKKRMSFFRHSVSAAEARKFLPPMTREIRTVPADQLAPVSGEYTAALRRLMRERKEGDRVVGKESAEANQSELELRLTEAARRLRPAVVAEVVAAMENGQKVCVFTDRHDECDALGEEIEKAVKAADVTGKVWCVHGGNANPTKREGVRLAYMAHRGACVLVSTGSSFGTSSDLQDTDCGILAFVPWSPGLAEQWEGRWPRGGQLRPLRVLYMFGEGTANIVVRDALRLKLAAVEAIIGDQSAIHGIRKDFEGDPAVTLKALLDQTRLIDESLLDDDDD